MIFGPEDETTYWYEEVSPLELIDIDMRLNEKMKRRQETMMKNPFLFRIVATMFLTCPLHNSWLDEIDFLLEQEK